MKNWMHFSRQPEIVLAQYAELKRQVPLLYALLVLNACAVGYTHYTFAPAWTTLGFLGFLIVVCGWRIARWIAAPGAGEIAVSDARAQLIRTTLLAGVLGAVFIAWSLLIDQYGEAAERGHVALFIAATVIGCIFCLVYLPQAALLVTAVVTLPYLLYYTLRGDPVFIAMALNIALVSGVMVRVLLNSFNGFKDMIESRSALAAKQGETERLSIENARLAHTDMLTGLPNRRYFFNCLEEALAAARASKSRVVVGVLDLDRFKPVNDTYGHAMGDRLLADVGKRLSSIASAETLLARLGGDEFGLLLTGSVGDVQAVGQTICDMLAVPFVIDGQRINLGCSAGLAAYPEAGTCVHELFDRSDYALYHVKSVKRGRCALFSLEHETLIRSERAIEAALQAADFETELGVVYQPIICLNTQTVIGVEALGRWTSPAIGAVPPDRFITTAERVGTIHSLTLMLFKKALSDFRRMPAGLRLSFNLSAHDITSAECLDRLMALIVDAGVNPGRLTFELTETALMRDFEAAVSGIEALRALGARVALDDFGTGYSSLGYLRQLPLDTVKVDGSFALNVTEQSGRNILSAILGLCRTLGLECVIEGVESDVQLAALQALGYRAAQGYLFARPMSFRSLLDWCDGAGTTRGTDAEAA